MQLVMTQAMVHITKCNMSSASHSVLFPRNVSILKSQESQASQVSVTSVTSVRRVRRVTSVTSVTTVTTVTVFAENVSEQKGGK
jgi:hypothetical protein